jgi:hypothetical protein
MGDMDGRDLNVWNGAHGDRLCRCGGAAGGSVSRLLTVELICYCINIPHPIVFNTLHIFYRSQAAETQLTG